LKIVIHGVPVDSGSGFGIEFWFWVSVLEFPFW